jgi:hypothetical protein
MAIPDWPSTLPTEARRAGFSGQEAYRPPVVTEVEDGPDLMRPSGSTIIEKVAYRIRMTSAQFDTFKAFARDTLGQGVSHFHMSVLTGGATYETRRVYLEGGKFGWQPHGRDWDVSFNLCIFPAGS